jgi:ribosomal protein S2
MGHQVTALLGIVEDAIKEVVTEIIQRTIPGHAALTVREVRTLPEIQQAAVEGKFDLAVLLLNNIITMGKDDRPLASALAGVRHLANLGVPVISICGWNDMPNVADLALAAGSRFHFPAPFDAGAFQAAVRQCLGL